MKKRYITIHFLLFLVVGLFPIAGLAEGEGATSLKEQTKEKFLELRERFRERFQELTEQESGEFLQKGKDFLLHVEDTAEQTVQKYRDQIAASESVSEEVKKEAQEELGQMLGRVTATEEIIMNAQSFEDLRGASKTILQETRAARQLVRRLKAEDMLFDMTQIVNRAETVAQKIAKDEAKFQKNGVNTEELEKAQEVFRKTLIDLKATLEIIKGQIAEVKSGARNEVDVAMVEKAKSEIKTLKEEFRRIVEELQKVYTQSIQETEGENAAPENTASEPGSQVPENGSSSNAP